MKLHFYWWLVTSSLLFHFCPLLIVSRTTSNDHHFRKAVGQINIRDGIVDLEFERHLSFGLTQMKNDVGTIAFIVRPGDEDHKPRNDDFESSALPPDDFTLHIDMTLALFDVTTIHDRYMSSYSVSFVIRPAFIVANVHAKLISSVISDESCGVSPEPSGADEMLVTSPKVWNLDTFDIQRLRAILITVPTAEQRNNKLALLRPFTLVFEEGSTPKALRYLPEAYGCEGSNGFGVDDDFKPVPSSDKFRVVATSVRLRLKSPTANQLALIAHGDTPSRVAQIYSDMPALAFEQIRLRSSVGCTSDEDGNACSIYFIDSKFGCRSNADKLDQWWRCHLKITATASKTKDDESYQRIGLLSNRVLKALLTPAGPPLIEECWQKEQSGIKKSVQWLQYNSTTGVFSKPQPAMLENVGDAANRQNLILPTGGGGTFSDHNIFTAYRCVVNDSMSSKLKTVREVFYGNNASPYISKCSGGSPRLPPSKTMLESDPFSQNQTIYGANCYLTERASELEVNVQLEVVYDADLSEQNVTFELMAPPYAKAVTSVTLMPDSKKQIELRLQFMSHVARLNPDLITNRKAKELPFIKRSKKGKIYTLYGPFNATVDTWVILGDQIAVRIATVPISFYAFKITR